MLKEERAPGSFGLRWSDLPADFQKLLDKAVKAIKNSKTPWVFAWRRRKLARQHRGPERKSECMSR